jgi:GT2 family glycosyltransferase
LKKPTYSLISPTFKRPDEVTEFLESLLEQNHQSFEVILGDGTPGDELRPLLKRFEDNPVYPLNIVYKEFLPVSNARNEAASVARGDYFIFLDSDCLIPANYLNELDIALAERPLDLFGGPDAAREDFSNLQKAISYAMTATLTTGGIRGKEKHVGTYHPRGFNMGVSRQAFEAVGGYDTAFVCGEDVELSIRIIEAGFTSGFIPNAYVYHKRRTTLTKFYRQVFRFGAARINLWKAHPSELKAAHLFPLFFSAFTVFSILAIPLFSSLFFKVLLVYVLAVLLDSSLQNRSVAVGLLSVACVFTMHFGYGMGFAQNYIARVVLKSETGIKL